MADKQNDDAILKEAREQFALAFEADTEARKRWLEDVKFNSAGGNQWDSKLKQMRENSIPPRPCLEIPLTQLHTRQVINDMRQNRPSIKVLPVDSNADKRTAEIYNGLIRNVEVCSDADIAYDNACLGQVEGGFGYFRIVTEVVDEAQKLKDAVIKPVWNPLCVFMDPFHEHPAAQDAEWGFIVQDMLRSKIERDHPDADILDWKGADELGAHKPLWYVDEKTVRVAEYLMSVIEDRNCIYVGEDEYTEEAYWNLKKANPLIQFTGTRTKKVKVVYWYKMLGNTILERTEYPSQYLGIIRVPGWERIIDGKRDVRGMVFDLKDPARLFNYFESLKAERIALAPKAPYIVPDESIEGYESDWQRANVDNLPYLKYKPLSDQDGRPLPAPQRAAPIQQDMGLIEASLQSRANLEYTAGRFEATYGARSNEQSGRAILARKASGEISTFHFTDNLNRAIRYAGRVLVDMLPRLKDVRHIARVLGEDNSTEFATIDPQMPMAYAEQESSQGTEKFYNLGVGKYDVVVTAGPSYQTRRMEAMDFMTQLAQADPTLMQKAGDLILRNSDSPGSDELAERLKKFLPPEIQDDGENEQDKVNQAVQAAQQQMMAQIEPMLGQLKQALDEAAKDAQQKDGEIQRLKVQLASRESEQITRIKEAVIEAMSRREVAEIQAQASTRDSMIDAHARQGEADAQVTQEVIRANAVRQGNYGDGNEQ